MAPMAGPKARLDSKQAWQDNFRLVKCKDCGKIRDGTVAPILNHCQTCYNAYFLSVSMKRDHKWNTKVSSKVQMLQCLLCGYECDKCKIAFDESDCLPPVSRATPQPFIQHKPNQGIHPEKFKPLKERYQAIKAQESKPKERKPRISIADKVASSMPSFLK